MSPVSHPPVSDTPVSGVAGATHAPRVAVVIVAAGRGTRAMRADDSSPKQYVRLGERAIIAETLQRFARHPRIGATLAVIHPDDAQAYASATAGIAGLLPPETGGATRQLSVKAGLERLERDGAPDFVLIHDAVRPFISDAVIDRVIDGLARADGVLAALPVADTLKRVDGTGAIAETVPRTGLWAAQTPQGFRFAAILTAHRRAAATGLSELTDDAAVAEWAGLEVHVVTGEAANSKITTVEDLERAAGRQALARQLALGDVRVGTGFDVHTFGPGSFVTLGGIEIAHTHGLVGHSDADVVLHALTDAVLGAIGDGDIGQHFPPSDPQWRGAASSQFLADAVRRVHERGGIIAQLDATVVCEAPRVGPHREAMKAKIAAIAGIAPDRVGIKATTSEGLGFTGRREGIVAMATATVRLPFTD